MAVFLVRHAKAGDRHKWRGPDDVRPLTANGEEQARGLVDLLGDRAIARVLSSPSRRCVQTVAPLADVLGLDVEEREELAEGVEAPRVVALVRELGGTDAVLCTHGDVIPTLLDALARTDGLRLPAGYPCAKGSTWVLDADESGRVTEASYLDPPA